MADDVVMPRLSDSMEEGTVLSWIKSVGDEVAVGDELVEIETDKANMVYEADTAGTLVEIVAEEGATLPIGEVIARIGEAGEVSESPGDSSDEGSEGSSDEGSAAAPEAEGDDVDRGSSAVPASAPPRVHAADAPPDASPPASDSGEAPDEATPTQPEAETDGASGDSAASPAGEGDRAGGRVKASPLARRMAKERGVDLGSLSGSGPGGRIIKLDVERAGAAPAKQAPAPAASQAETEPTPGAREKPETARGTTEVVELTKLQQTVSRRMAESKATAPHFYLQANIDMTRCFAARAQIKATAGEGDVVPSFNDMVVKACAIALREFPRANGAYRDGRLELYSRVNVGVAVAARDALVVPTIYDADRKGLRQIAAESRSLAQRVRDATVTPPELSGGTFTVSNLGMYGVSNFHAVLNPPQAGILAVGAITETPVVRDGEIATARLMGVTLACDHRILYGADGAEFLARIRALLEEPLGLAL